MPEIELRNALEYGIEEAYKLFKPMHDGLCYSELNQNFEYPRTPFITSIEEFRENLSEDNIFFIVLKENNEKVIGYIMLSVFTSGVAQIREIMITPENRRHNYGRSAVRKLAEGLKEDEEIRKVKVISATIATDNFYSSCNFRWTEGDIYEFRLK